MKPILCLVVCLGMVAGGQAEDGVRKIPAGPSDVSYREGGEASTQCRLDVYLPPRPEGPFPLLVWFHGGGLKGGSKTSPDTVRLAQSLAEQGVGVVVAGYRLNPEVRFPVYLQDAAQAVRWAVDHAVSLKAQPQVFVGGHSAGAYLAALLAMDSSFLTEAGVASDRIAGVIAMSGQMMTHFTVAEERGISNKVLTADDAAPIHHLRNDHPPLLLLIGDNDWPARLEENLYFCAALRKVGESGRVALSVVAGRDHAGILHRAAEPGDPAGEVMLRFLKGRGLPDAGGEFRGNPAR